MIKQLAHFCIHAQVLEKTYQFYTEVLGFSKGFEFEKKGELFGYYLKAGNNTFIEIFKGDPGESGNILHVAFEVDNMDEIIARIRSHGIDMQDKKLGPDFSWQVWVTDPNGVRIEFHEYTEKSMQLHGGVCPVTW